MAGSWVSPVSAARSFSSGLLLDDSQMVIALLLFPCNLCYSGKAERRVRDRGWGEGCGGEGRDPRE